MMELNKIYHTDFMNNTLPDKSVQLIIADPPYFEVKGEFDFIWSSFDDYLADVEKWAQECKRLLADNGTLYWWGDHKKIAYSQIILDKYFYLENNMVWEKTECQTRRNSPDEQRSYAPVTERFLFYSSIGNAPAEKAENAYKFQTGKLKTEIMEPIVSYLISEMDRAGLNCKKINQLTGTSMASHWFARTSQWALPTEEWYNKLREIFNTHGKAEYLRNEYEELRNEYEELRNEYEELRNEYEELRNEYEELRRPFFNDGSLLFDVFHYSQESHITSNFQHDTKKPETLTRRLILTSSRKGDTVLAPFAGSGTECAMAAKEGRNFIGFDVNEKYVNMAQDRCDKILAQPSLF